LSVQRRRRRGDLLSITSWSMEASVSVSTKYIAISMGLGRFRHGARDRMKASMIT